MSAFEQKILQIDTSNLDDYDDLLLDHHPVVSPETPAESFFISPELRTNNVSAFALADQLRGKSRASSVATEDFQPAFDNETDMYNHSTHGVVESLFGKDILVHSRNPISEADDETYQDTMSQPVQAKAVNEGPNAAQVVYEKAKDIWSWGKGLPIVGFFEGVTESVAAKAVSIAGTSLEGIDSAVKPHLAGLDTSYLNPAIEAIVKMIMGGVSKAETIVGAILPAVLGPVGLIEAEKKDEETTPELTGASKVYAKKY
jgi:hypothetical protein